MLLFNSRLNTIIGEVTNMYEDYSNGLISDQIKLNTEETIKSHIDSAMKMLMLSMIISSYHLTLPVEYILSKYFFYKTNRLDTGKQGIELYCEVALFISIVV